MSEEKAPSGEQADAAVQTPDEQQQAPEPRPGDTGEPVPEAPEPAAQDEGYAPSSGGETGSYAQDVAMMRAEIDHIDTTVLPHYELLIAQATKAGNGTATVQALNAGLEATRTARGSAAAALSAVQATSEPVQQAYDNSGGEAATDKDYFAGD